MPARVIAVTAYAPSLMAARLLSYARTARDTLRAYAWWLRTELAAQAGPTCTVRRRAAHSLILLAWSFPPKVNGGTYRPLALARYASALGWNVFVIGGEPEAPTGAAGTYLLGTVPATVRVARLAPPSLRLSYRWVPRIDGTFLSAFAMFDVGRRAFRSSRPTAVVASGPPFHVFAAGYYLARAFRCKLILDYRDEWTECPFDFVACGNADRWWERRCLKAADAVVFTTRSQLEHQLQVFGPLDPAKCFLIPNGWEPADTGVVGGTVEEWKPDRKHLVLSFVGTLGSWMGPGTFLSTLDAVLQNRADLKRLLRIKFVGLKPSAILEQLRAFRHKDVLELVDEVPKPTATAIMRRSTALLLLNDPKLARYIPGKLYEYIAAGRPVLVFGDGGEIAALVRKLDAGVVVPREDARALEGALNDLARSAVSRGSTPAIQEWLAAHTRERLAREVLDLVEKIVDRSTDPN